MRLNTQSNGHGLGCYTLVPFLRKEAEFIDHQIVLVQDNMYTQDNRQKYCIVQKRFNTIWDHYLNGVIISSNLLKKTAALYGNL